MGRTVDGRKTWETDLSPDERGLCTLAAAIAGAIYREAGGDTSFAEIAADSVALALAIIEDVRDRRLK